MAKKSKKCKMSKTDTNGKILNDFVKGDRVKKFEIVEKYDGKIPFVALDVEKYITPEGKYRCEIKTSTEVSGDGFTLHSLNTNKAIHIGETDYKLVRNSFDKKRDMDEWVANKVNIVKNFVSDFKAKSDALKGEAGNTKIMVL